MSKPKHDKPQRREPGPKTKKPVIPEKFTISRPINPFQAILQESEKNNLDQSDLRSEIEATGQSENPVIEEPGKEYRVTTEPSSQLTQEEENRVKIEPGKNRTRFWHYWVL